MTVTPARRGRPRAAWRAYAHGSEVDHFARFAEALLEQSDDRWEGLPLRLEAWQRRMLGEALAYDEHGTPTWGSIVLILPRKNGKTSLLAAVALYHLLTSDGRPEILLAASSDRQADRLFQAAARFVRRNAELSKLLRVRDHVGEIVREDGMGVVYRMTSDPTRLHGYNPTLVVIDELAQWGTPTLRRAFAALTSGGGARSAPQTFTITTAGEARDREDGILGTILDGALADGDVEAAPGLTVIRHHAARMLIYNHEAPTIDPRDTAAMKLANPASWITEAYLREQAENPELTDAQVLQLHGCVWAAGRSEWLPAGAWRECSTGGGFPPDGTQITLGFDGSYNNDSTALVGCTLEGYVFVVGVWERPDTRGEWRVPRDDVDAAVADALARWSVAELACDPPGWHREVGEWSERYGSPPIVFYETGRRSVMGEACSRFYTAVVNRQLTHDGNGALARHLGNAVVRERDGVAMIAKESRSSQRKIDLAVAAVVAYDRAMQTTKSDVFFAWA